MIAYQDLFSCKQQKLLVDPVLWEYLLETAAAVMIVSHSLEVSGLISEHRDSYDAHNAIAALITYQVFNDIQYSNPESK